MLESLGQKFRFDIFKRDKFTCQYCGSRPPDVVLNIEHILPVSGGGTNDPLNLTTACWDCNIGKGSRLVSSETMAPVLLRNAEHAKARQDQLEAYSRLLSEQSKKIDRIAESLTNMWGELKGEDAQGFYHIHNELNSSLRIFIVRLPAKAIIEAMKIAYSKMPVDWAKEDGGLYDKRFRYFCGVCWGMVRQKEEAGSCM